MMIGREISTHFPPKPDQAIPGTAHNGQTRKRWNCGIFLGKPAAAISTSTVRKNEIVGLGGLDGQGQKDLLLGLFGVLKASAAPYRLTENRSGSTRHWMPKNPVLTWR